MGTNEEMSLFINVLFLAALGLRCCVQAFSSWGKWGPLVVSLIVERGL